MNSIRRPRKHPRVDSISWCSLWWVLTREAALRVRFPRTMQFHDVGVARCLLSEMPTYRVRRMAEARLVRFPERRMFP